MQPDSTVDELRRGLHGGRSCPSCHAPVGPDDKNCGRCGCPLTVVRPTAVRVGFAFGLIIRPILKLGVFIAILFGVAVAGLTAYLSFVVVPPLAPTIHAGDCLRVSQTSGATDIGRVVEASATSLVLKRADGTNVSEPIAGLPIGLRLRIDTGLKNSFCFKTALGALKFSGGLSPMKQVSKVSDELGESLRQSQPPFPASAAEIERLAKFFRPRFVIDPGPPIQAGSTISVWQANGIVLTGPLLQSSKTNLVVSSAAGVKQIPLHALAFEQRCQMDPEFVERVASVRSAAFARAAITNVGCVPPAIELGSPEDLVNALKIGDPQAMMSAAKTATENKHQSESFLFLEAAASGGNAAAMEALGKKYISGDGINQDKKRGTELLAQAAQPTGGVQTTNAPAEVQSVVLARCSTCKGLGTVACAKCNALGHFDKCPQCGGTGRYSAHMSGKKGAPSPCPFCNGGGLGKPTSNAQAQPCPACNGTGRTICSVCRGTGQAKP